MDVHSLGKGVLWVATKKSKNHESLELYDRWVVQDEY